MYSETEKKCAWRLLATAIKDGIDYIPPRLTPDHFHEPKLKTWIRAARETGDPYKAALDVGIDVVALTQRSGFIPLKQGELIKSIDVILDGNRRRHLFGITKIIEKQLVKGDPVSDVLNSLHAALSSADYRPASMDSQTLTSALGKAIENLKRRGSDDFASGVDTGIENLNKKKLLYPFGVISIIAARPSNGKSSLVRASVKANALQNKHSLVFSIEDTAETFALRMVATDTDIPVSVLLQGTLTTKQEKQVEMAYTFWQDYGDYVTIIDARTVKPEDVYAEAMLAYREKEIKAFYVDYAQVITGDEDKKKIDELIDYMVKATGVKNKEGRHDLAGVLVSQLKRFEQDIKEIDDLDDLPIPRMHHLKDTGDLEERVKGPLLGVLNPSFYKKDLAPNNLFVYVMKNSNGEVTADSAIPVDWNGPTTTVS